MRFPQRSRTNVLAGNGEKGGGFRRRWWTLAPRATSSITTAQQLVAVQVLLCLIIIMVVVVVTNRMQPSSWPSTAVGVIVVHAWTPTTSTGARGRGRMLGHRPERAAFTTTSSTSRLFLFDRFTAECPASLNSIRQFAPSLVPATSTAPGSDNGNKAEDPNESDTIWVAVYRSNQNQPSVLVRDEFLHALHSATDVTAHSPALVRGPAVTTTPVAVGRLVRLQRPQQPITEEREEKEDDDTTTSTFLIDSLRCVLKKETIDTTCDGGSEHTEALLVALDHLVLHYLRQSQHQQSQSVRFHGCLRVKGTLVTGPLLEDRGWDPVADLEPDWATHTSSLDGCLSRYAARAATTTTASAPQAQQRAMEIVSHLGRLDREADLAAAAVAARKRQEQQQQRAANRDDEEDTWAGMKRFF